MSTERYYRYTPLAPGLIAISGFVAQLDGAERASVEPIKEKIVMAEPPKLPAKGDRGKSGQPSPILIHENSADIQAAFNASYGKGSTARSAAIQREIRKTKREIQLLDQLQRKHGMGVQ